MTDIIDLIRDGINNMLEYPVRTNKVVMTKAQRSLFTPEELDKALDQLGLEMIPAQELVAADFGTMESKTLAWTATKWNVPEHVLGGTVTCRISSKDIFEHRNRIREQKALNLGYAYGMQEPVIQPDGSCKESGSFFEHKTYKTRKESK